MLKQNSWAAFYDLLYWYFIAGCWCYTFLRLCKIKFVPRKDWVNKIFWLFVVGTWPMLFYMYIRTRLAKPQKLNHVP